MTLSVLYQFSTSDIKNKQTKKSHTATYRLLTSLLLAESYVHKWNQILMVRFYNFLFPLVVFLDLLLSPSTDCCRDIVLVPGRKTK